MNEDRAALRSYQAYARRQRRLEAAERLGAVLLALLFGLTCIVGSVTIVDWLIARLAA